METKVATLADVREWGEGEPVELWVNRSGRLVLRAYNECRNNTTEVDVLDLLAWFERGNAIGSFSAKGAVAAGSFTASN